MNDKVNKLTPHKDGKRRRMIMKTLTNVALTERGANPEANVTFYKSFNGKDTDENKDSDLNKRLLLCESEEGHTHLLSINEYNSINMGGETSWHNGHDHPFVINDDGSIIIGEVAGHAHQYIGNVNYLIKTENEKSTETVIDSNLNKEEFTMGDKNENTEITIAEAVDKISELETALARAVKMALLNDTQKAHFNTLEDELKEVFLSKSEEERDDDIKAVKAENPVVYKALDGTIFVKSDDPRFVKMAKEADEGKKALAKAKDETETLKLTKRATEEFSNLPGKPESHVELLKVISTIENEEVRQDIEGLLKAHNESMDSVYKGIGTTTNVEKVDDAAKELDRLTRVYLKDNPEVTDYFDAYEIVKNKNTDLYKKAVAQG